LVAAVIIAYQPAWHAGFIWDDDEYVTENPLLSAPDGLKRIWFSLDSPSQYFPLTYTAFYIERAAWGLNPGGYHWVNLLLHAANALLVWRLLELLRVPGAWLAAAVFALHPVQVESVAWITELKNLLSTLFCLFTLLAWVRFVGGSESGRVSLTYSPTHALTFSSVRWRYYGLALVLYALALCSKTTACTLPAAFLLTLWLKEKPINRGRLAQVAPFLAMGAGMGLLAIWWERYHQGTQGKLFALGPVERILVASRAIWFYAGKLLWPAGLTFSYPRWTIDSAALAGYGWLIASAGLGMAVIFRRRLLGRGVEVALLFYVATLSPLLGFIMLYTFRYSFVADHYQYLAALGPIALAASGISRACETVQRNSVLIKRCVPAALIVTLGVLTWRQSRIYVDSEALWQATLKRNPGSFLACNNLGMLDLQNGRLSDAISRYEQALEIEPDFELARYNLGNALLQQGRVEDAISQYQKALELRPNAAPFHNNLGTALLRTGRLDEAIVHFERSVEIDPRNANAHNNLAIALRRKGRLDRALVEYQKALSLQPQNVALLNNLAWLLATSPRASIRNASQAVPLAQQASQLSGGANPTILQTLSAAYAEAGRFSDAVSTAQLALRLAAAANQPALVSVLQRQIALYQAGSPLRDASLGAAESAQ
jgi:tetratricopeptide (TPR) repeat protein